MENKGDFGPKIGVDDPTCPFLWLEATNFTEHLCISTDSFGKYKLSRVVLRWKEVHGNREHTKNGKREDVFFRGR